MKKLMFVFLSIGSIMFAQAQWASLNIQSANHSHFDVILNGQLLAQDVQDITITQLQAGQHFLEVRRSTNPWLNMGQNQGPNYQGTITVGPHTQLNALLFRNQLFVEYQETPVPHVSGYGQGSNGSYDNYYYPGSGQVNYNSNYIPGMQTHWNVPPPSCPGYEQIPIPTGPQAMDAGTFQQLKQSIQAQWFSTGQKEVAMQALANNYFTSQQILELVDLFTFSSDQLEVAKFAYLRAVDPHNYFIVSNALDFSHDVSELSSYIAAL